MMWVKNDDDRKGIGPFRSCQMQQMMVKMVRDNIVQENTLIFELEYENQTAKR